MCAAVERGPAHLHHEQELPEGPAQADVARARDECRELRHPHMRPPANARDTPRPGAAIVRSDRAPRRRASPRWRWQCGIGHAGTARPAGISRPAGAAWHAGACWSDGCDRCPGTARLRRRRAARTAGAAGTDRPDWRNRLGRAGRRDRSTWSCGSHGSCGAPGCDGRRRSAGYNRRYRAGGRDRSGWSDRSTRTDRRDRRRRSSWYNRRHRAGGRDRSGWSDWSTGTDRLDRRHGSRRSNRSDGLCRRNRLARRTGQRARPDQRALQARQGRPVHRDRSARPAPRVPAGPTGATGATGATGSGTVTVTVVRASATMSALIQTADCGATSHAVGGGGRSDDANDTLVSSFPSNSLGAPVGGRLDQPAVLDGSVGGRPRESHCVCPVRAQLAGLDTPVT